MAQEYSSGTVSKILWHFTGGPEWDFNKNRQSNYPKKLNKAYSNLKSILNDKRLNLSRYPEVFKVKTPTFDFDSEKKELIKKGYEDKELQASPICCLADIPIQHLNYHSKRYGKFAIGFHRKSAVRSSFNPVLYSLNSTEVVNSIYNSLSNLSLLDFDEIVHSLDQYFDNLDVDNSLFLKAQTTGVINVIDYLSELKEKIEENLKDVVSFVKTFTYDEFNTVYCEREWRSLRNFTFNESDIAMIVLPKYKGYYKKFLLENLVPGIPVVPWEDLIES